MCDFIITRLSVAYTRILMNQSQANRASKNKNCGAHRATPKPSQKFMKLRSIDILLASAKLKQAWLTPFTSPVIGGQKCSARADVLKKILTGFFCVYRELFTT